METAGPFAMASLSDEVASLGKQAKFRPCVASALADSFGGALATASGSATAICYGPYSSSYPFCKVFFTDSYPLFFKVK